MQRRTWILRLLPWAITGVVLFVLARRYDPRTVLEQMRSGCWHGAAPFAFFVPFLYLVGHAFWDTLVIRGSLRRSVPYLDVARGRAATAMLTIVGYVFGHGGFGVWLVRRTGAGAREASGTVLYTMLSDLGGLAVVAAATTWLAGPEAPAAVRTSATAIAAASLALVAIGPVVLRGTSAPSLSAFRHVRPHVGVLQILGRAIDVGIVVAAAAASARAFGLAIPLSAFVTYMPVVLLVASIPVNIGGFGAAQAAWLVFLPWESGERILAFQLVWQLFMALGIAVRGAPFLPALMRDLGRSRGGDAYAASTRAS